MKRMNRISPRRDVPRLYIQAVFALAAALALSTSACGKGGGGGATPVTTNGAGVAAPASDTADIGKIKNSPDALAAKAKAKANAKKSTGADQLSKVSSTSSSLAVPPNNTTGDGEPNEMDEALYTITDPVKEVKKAKPVVEDEPFLESVIYYDPNGPTKDQIFAKKKRMNEEGVWFGEHVRSDIVNTNGADLFYTGSSDDVLRDLLYVKVNEREAKQHPIIRDGDKELSQTIQLSDFNVDWSSRRAELNFRFEGVDDRTGKMTVTKAKLEGPIDNVTKFNVGDLGVWPFLQAEVACMDIDLGCKTVHIRMQDKSTGNIRTAHLIARKTNAMMFVNADQTGSIKNREFGRFLDILVDSVNLSKKLPMKGRSYVNQLTMTTSETIGGASNFTVTMKMCLEEDQYGCQGGDTVEMTGPLAKARGTDNLNIAANLSPALTVYGNEVVPTSVTSNVSRISETIRDVRLLRNDGRGNIQLEVMIRKATTEAEVERILLSVGRINTATTTVRIPMQ